MEIFNTDVLIIGAGGAGLRAAIEAHDQERQAMVLSKSVLGKAHTVMAEGGVAAALANVDPADSWQMHFHDTMVEGQRIADWEMVEALVKEIPERIKELEEWGALFDRTEDGKIAQRAFGAHTCRRTCYIGDRIGLEILHTLEDQVIQRGIHVRDETMATKIVSDRNGALGVVGVDFKRGEIFAVEARAVIVATGGAGRIYRISSTSWESSGYGYALAYEAGAELQDMEMIQFHPTGMVYPESAAGLLVTEAVRGEGGILLNAKGEQFMQKYDPKRMELSARDVVARAVYQEVQEGRGTEHGGVWLDITAKGAEYIQAKLPSMYMQFKEYAHVDITKERMEVAPTAHYTMGGIRTSAQGETAVKGLFAAGEAASGVHGANRLGGNSLADILVFGKRTGNRAAAYAAQKNQGKIPGKILETEKRRLEAVFEGDGKGPFAIKERLQQTMWKNAGIAKNESGLREALQEIEELKTIRLRADGSMRYNPMGIDAIQMPAVLTVAEAIVRSALERKESRGAHYRTDYPDTDDGRWKANVICKKKGGGMVLEVRKVREPPVELNGLIG